MSFWKGIIGKGFTADEFKAYVAGLDISKTFAKFLVLHNTALPTLAQWHSVSGEKRMAALANYYQNVQGWSGGPHLFIADDLIWVFTPLTVPGVHSPSWNSISFGAEIVLDGEQESFTDPQKSLVLSALATLHIAAHLDPDTLKFHFEDPKTTHKCPGKNVIKQDVVARLKEEISSRK